MGKKFYTHPDNQGFVPPEGKALHMSWEIVNALTRRGETLATAESCTGGGIATCLTEIPGSSRVLWGGIVCYSNEAKVAMLDLDPLLFAHGGAVSPDVARSMAWGVRKRSAADWTLAVTGIAGPGGGTPEKPVGTVWIAWCNPDGIISAKVFHFDGDRAMVRRQTEDRALKELFQLIKQYQTTH